MKHKRAFTLIELLVAILILSILVAMSLVSYADRKKHSEYNGAVATVGLIAATEKNYFMTTGAYLGTTGTPNTNLRLELRIVDGYFRNYRVNVGAPFTVLVDGGNCVYTFNSEGALTGNNGGSDCLS